MKHNLPKLDSYRQQTIEITSFKSKNLISIFASDPRVHHHHLKICLYFVSFQSNNFSSYFIQKHCEYRHVYPWVSKYKPFTSYSLARSHCSSFSLSLPLLLFRLVRFPFHIFFSCFANVSFLLIVEYFMWTFIFWEYIKKFIDSKEKRPLGFSFSCNAHEIFYQ